MLLCVVADMFVAGSGVSGVALGLVGDRVGGGPQESRRFGGVHQEQLHKRKLTTFSASEPILSACCRTGYAALI